jgi:hypothetical protein
VASNFDLQVDELVDTLERGVGGQAVKIVNDEMQRLMKKVQQEARARAPEEHGNLVDAIKIQSANRRRSWSVYVDESMPDDTGQYTVGDYAAFIHEGSYKLGPKSLAKLAANSLVGPKFLEGAFLDIVNSAAVTHLQRLLDSELERRAKARGGI